MVNFKDMLNFKDMVNFKDDRKYHLTGSRFFGNYTPESDYDYFVQYDNTVTADLISAGFKKCGKSYQEDPFGCMVFIRDNIHVQIIYDANRKKYVQEILKPYFKRYNPDKATAKIMWHLTYDLTESSYWEKAYEGFS